MTTNINEKRTHKAYFSRYFMDYLYSLEYDELAFLERKIKGWVSQDDYSDQLYFIRNTMREVKIANYIDQYLVEEKLKQKEDVEQNRLWQEKQTIEKKQLEVEQNKEMQKAEEEKRKIEEQKRKETEKRNAEAEQKRKQYRRNREELTQKSNSSLRPLVHSSRLHEEIVQRW